MEPKNRNVWILAAVVLVVLCCIALAVALILMAGLGIWSADGGGVGSSSRDRIEEAFEVGSTPTLEIDNFAGSVSVRAGEGSTIHVVATKRASSTRALEQIEVEISPLGSGLVIKTHKPAGLNLSNARVEWEITVPVGTRLSLRIGSGSADVQGLAGGVEVDTGSGNLTLVDLAGGLDAHTGSGGIDINGASGDVRAETGSGSIDIQDVSGEIDAHTGSGGIKVRGSTGIVRLDTGSGGVEYEGTPEGDCRFTTGSGGITLMLPSDLNVEVDLETGSGDITVDFAVDGRVTRRDVEGSIGSGDQGKIYARTGSGGIELTQR